MDFLEDRLRWLDQKQIDIRDAYDSPLAGFESLITDSFTDSGGVVRQLQLGIGITVQRFEELAKSRADGEDITADLANLLLDEEAFDSLAWAWQLRSTSP